MISNKLIVQLKQCGAQERHKVLQVVSVKDTHFVFSIVMVFFSKQLMFQGNWKGTEPYESKIKNKSQL